MTASGRLVRRAASQFGNPASDRAVDASIHRGGPESFLRKIDRTVQFGLSLTVVNL